MVDVAEEVGVDVVTHGCTGKGDGEILEAPANESKKDMYMSVYVDSGPRRQLSLASLLSELNQSGGRHRIDHTEMVKNHLVGMKSRGVYDTPGGTVLFAAQYGLTHFASLGCSNGEDHRDNNWDIYNQANTTGFIWLYGFPMRVRAILEKLSIEELSKCCKYSTYITWCSEAIPSVSKKLNNFHELVCKIIHNF
ncbi:Argininosuccinate synthase [Trema orientale]|uniref:argininosuccinate synthase n=1 Tax=Trema orientale TaxID=63057 RepID=A0A2P5DIC9_TREOI|nr:Argininosuccinate synthase [Trema orientale]